jgi:NAD(P)-dependent dehydrogenase (short-subunit alcohol dehydrogenase family)
LPGRLSGKVAVVTGGGTGIGRSICRLFAAEGADVVVAGRRAEPIEAVAAEVSGLAVRTDVAREEEVRALIQTCSSRFGQIDVLVNNAGITGPISNADDLDVDRLDETLAVNVRGLLLCIKHAVPEMRRRHHGSIINMSSRLGLKGHPMRSAYVASKFAVIGITQSVAAEVGVYGIRVNALCPGAVSGELMDSVLERRAREEGRSPAEIAKSSYSDVAALRRWVTPEEVAESALFLASDASLAVTATHLVVDAGRMD